MSEGSRVGKGVDNCSFSWGFAELGFQPGCLAGHFALEPGRDHEQHIESTY